MKALFSLDKINREISCTSMRFMAINDRSNAMSERDTETTTGPLLVASVFKLAAIAALGGGILGTLQLGRTLNNGGTYSSSSRTWIILGTVVVTALVAATFAFFGYVLDLLREIRDKNDAR